MTDRCPDTIDLFGADLPAAAEQLVGDEKENRWPRQMAEMTDVLLDEVSAYDARVDPLWARRLVYRLVVRLCTEYGGGNWYIPKDDAFKRVLRDLWLWTEHDGSTYGPKGADTLSHRVGLSINRVWAILKRQRALHRQHLQPDLFEGLDAAPGKRP